MPNPGGPDPPEAAGTAGRCWEEQYTFQSRSATRAGIRSAGWSFAQSGETDSRSTGANGAAGRPGARWRVSPSVAPALTAARTATARRVRSRHRPRVPGRVDTVRPPGARSRDDLSGVDGRPAGPQPIT